MKPILADVERHQRIGVGGDRVGTGVDKFFVNLTHDLGALHQRQGRPFRLYEAGAEPGQFPAHAAIEDLEGLGHAKSPLLPNGRRWLVSWLILSLPQGRSVLPKFAR